MVFGGGTATNSLVDVFENIRKSRNCSLSYVIPISDNGGSSSELIRVFGGPGMEVSLFFSAFLLSLPLLSSLSATDNVYRVMNRYRGYPE